MEYKGLLAQDVRIRKQPHENPGKCFGIVLEDDEGNEHLFESCEDCPMTSESFRILKRLEQHQKYLAEIGETENFEERFGPYECPKIEIECPYIR